MTTSNTRWFYPRGALTRGSWETVVDDSLPGWQHTRIAVAELTPGKHVTLDDTDVERIVVPLSGSFDVDHRLGGRDAHTHLAGRASVFAGPTDVVYLPTGSTGTIAGTGRVAVAAAATDIAKPLQYIPASATPVELRGAGRCSRQVHNFGTPEALDAARLIVCEVLTPAGNWSSYPPHKHDEHVPGHESRLEEIYYFETAVEGDQDPRAAAVTGEDDAPFALFATYSSAAGAIDVNAMVRSGGVALVPYGYHGPAAAPPGYDLYYLNVMAGPDPERIWLINDDPAYGWVREAWGEQAMDSRLPLHAAKG